MNDNKEELDDEEKEKEILLEYIRMQNEAMKKLYKKITETGKKEKRKRPFSDVWPFEERLRAPRPCGNAFLTRVLHASTSTEIKDTRNAKHFDVDLS